MCVMDHHGDTEYIIFLKFLMIELLRRTYAHLYRVPIRKIPLPQYHVSNEYLLSGFEQSFDPMMLL